jgi:transposase InsO family protein
MRVMVLVSFVCRCLRRAFSSKNSAAYECAAMVVLRLRHVTIQTRAAELMCQSVPGLSRSLDDTIIKLLNGTKAYLNAVIDNFSRRILAWTVAGRPVPMNTRDVLTTTAGAPACFEDFLRRFPDSPHAKQLPQSGAR